MTLEEGGGSDLKRVAEAASLIFCLVEQEGWIVFGSAEADPR